MRFDCSRIIISFKDIFDCLYGEVRVSKVFVEFYYIKGDKFVLVKGSLNDLANLVCH